MPSVSAPQAEALQKYRLLVGTSEREALRDPDEFYVQDLVGLSVVMAAGGQEVGRVVDVLSGMGSHDSLKVALCQSEEDKEKQQQRCVCVGGGG
jgi:ribosomal 30S subunit maturation factor RimM